MILAAAQSLTNGLATELETKTHAEQYLSDQLHRLEGDLMKARADASDIRQAFQDTKGRFGT